MNVAGTPSRRAPRFARPPASSEQVLNEVEWATVSTRSLVTLEQIASALLAAVKSCARNEGCARAAGQLDGGVKSLASGCVWRDHALLVTR